MMDEKTKQMVMDKLKMMKEKMDKENKMMEMDDAKMKTMLDKALTIVGDWDMDPKDTMIMGKMIKMIGHAMMKDGECGKC